MAVEVPHSISEDTNMSEGLESDSVGTPKFARSVSVCDAHQLPSSQRKSGDGRYPPVLVLSHPSTQKMATRLVQATTARTLKLKLNATVRIV